MDTQLDDMISALTPASTEHEVRGALVKLFRAALGPTEHERAAERIRRQTRIARSTFKRLMKHTQVHKTGDVERA